MKRVHENIKEFGNGNLNIRFDPEQIEDIKSGKVSDIEVISWTLEELDCYFVGDEFCLGNWTMGAMIYNAYSDVCYILDFSGIETVLMTGKCLKLYATAPDERIKEEYESWWK